MISTLLSEMLAATSTIGRGRLSRYSVPEPSSTDSLEAELSAFIGVEHTLAVNSGTSALYCALAALGVGPGDEVLVPAYTWISDAAAAVALGAVPVLVEIDESLTMDPVDLARKIGPKTRAIIPVHMLNLVCDMDALLAVARAHGIPVVEDACQAAGVLYHGTPVGGLADAGAFSFNQHKNLRAGEGGALTTNDSRIAARATLFHDVGSYTRSSAGEIDEPGFVGLNLRMSELTSAVLRPQVRRLERQIARRRRGREIVVEQLRLQGDIRVSPHNSPDEAVGLTVLFDDVADAIAFAEQRGVDRLLDTGRHVYTNWQPIVERRTYDERVNPWTDSDADYSPQACPATLDILARSCRISIAPDLPIPMLRARARTYTRPAASAASGIETAADPGVAETAAVRSS